MGTRRAGLLVEEAPLRPKPLPQLWNCPVEGCSCISSVYDNVQRHIDRHHAPKPEQPEAPKP